MLRFAAAPVAIPTRRAISQPLAELVSGASCRSQRVTRRLPGPQTSAKESDAYAAAAEPRRDTAGGIRASKSSQPDRIWLGKRRLQSSPYRCLGHTRGLLPRSAKSRRRVAKTAGSWPDTQSLSRSAAAAPHI